MAIRGVAFPLNTCRGGSKLVTRRHKIDGRSTLSNVDKRMTYGFTAHLFRPGFGCGGTGEKTERDSRRHR